MMKLEAVVTGRRGLLGMAGAAALAIGAFPRQSAYAQTADDAGAIAPVQRLNTALLAAMQAGQRTPFSQRFAALAPVIDQTFDLDAVLSASVGLTWPGLPEDQKAQLRTAFRRYTIASYAANFDSYSGQNFQVVPTARSVGNGAVIVQTSIVPTDGSTTKLDYVMRNGQTGWRVVDVLADGSISRVAVQRSDFRHLLSSGGVSALMEGLQHKVATLSGGMLA